MPHRLRKIRKQRRSRTHGWGQVGQHRSSGGRGGVGKAGGQKHKWTHTVKYDPNRYGKKGFKSIKKSINIINVGNLDYFLDTLLKQNLAIKDEKGIFIDLNKLGIDKLLGSGKITNSVTVKVKSYSKLAYKKITELGGKILKE